MSENDSVAEEWNYTELFAVLTTYFLELLFYVTAGDTFE